MAFKLISTSFQIEMEKANSTLTDSSSQHGASFLDDLSQAVIKFTMTMVGFFSVMTN